MANDAVLHFIRARLSTTANETVECAVTVRDGRIEALGALAPEGAAEVDCRGLWLLPGAIDAHVHFDEPGFTHREDFASGTKSAAAGGVTTIVDMPCTSLPPVVDAVSFDNKMACVRAKAYVDFAFWGGVRGNRFSVEEAERRIDELASRGVRSLKTYLISGMDTFEDVDPTELEHIMRLAARRDLVVGVHAEDRETILQCTAPGRAREDSPAAYARARSAEAEAKGIETAIDAAEKTGARLHIVHMACGAGVQLVRQARARGVRVTVETCPHYLLFTDEDLERMGALLKTAPVVKAASDRQALWEGLADGTIDMVATDHAPANWPEEKHTGSIWTDYGGVPGVELMLPVLLSEGVNKGRISLQRALELACRGPADVHRLAGKGSLKPGADADLVLFDPSETWTVRAADLVQRQKYTPCEGMTLTGRVQRTYVRGQLVFDGRQVHGPWGRCAMTR